MKLTQNSKQLYPHPIKYSFQRWQNLPKNWHWHSWMFERSSPEGCNTRAPPHLLPWPSPHTTLRGGGGGHGASLHGGIRVGTCRAQAGCGVQGPLIKLSLNTFMFKILKIPFETFSMRLWTSLSCIQGVAVCCPPPPTPPPQVKLPPVNPPWPNDWVNWLKP